MDLLELPRLTDADAASAEDPFDLDMRVVESTTPLVITMCSASDGCGTSCATSACTTRASDLP